jgi:sodium pump decarboxylase gamma subunit
MSFNNILESNGFGIAATGMTIVFAALSFITIFIYLLPKMLYAFELIVPAAKESPVASSSQSTDDEEIAAVIGFALHQRDTLHNEAI